MVDEAHTLMPVLAEMFCEHFGFPPERTEAFPHTASGRRYFRMRAGGQSAIGSYGLNAQENQAFVYFSRHFRAKGLPVPEIYSTRGAHYYLQQDLGGETLMDRNRLTPRPNGFPGSLLELYQKTIRQLVRLQIHGGEGLDYGQAYPRAAFDATSMHWDLNYFKYYFLNLSGLVYDEQSLQDDFSRLVQYLLSTNTQYFLVRDFQSRNVMLVDNEPYFIDYQGGRQGALQYDLASLLYQSKAQIPADIRRQLLDDYIQCANEYLTLPPSSFKPYYHGYVLMRLIQVLGAYGKRGLIEKMPYFLQSIPLALRNLREWLDTVELPVKIPYLRKTLRDLCPLEQLPSPTLASTALPLVVRIFSFSYKENIPKDASGNGGGFVFDCRHIHNPGRYAPYKTLTGRDKPVQDFLLQKSTMPLFLEDCKNILDRAVQDYTQRGFSSLMVGFGCTGGQHRSVFAADELARHLSGKHNVQTEVKHIVQERKGWQN